VINQFTELAQHPRVTFMGNVRLGSPVLSLPELRSFYNGVILAYGAESDKKLNVPGEHLSGVWSAREFVWWYNGHPSGSTLPIDLRNVHSVVICGLGNVAVDCARVLLRPSADLARTDMTDDAVTAMRQSAVREVHMLGRRGPAQAAFTPKELRELLGLEGIKIHIHPEGCLDLSSACREELKAHRVKRRIVEVMSKAVQQQQQQTTADHG